MRRIVKIEVKRGENEFKKVGLTLYLFEYYFDDFR
jgi:hypothetical protein